MIEGRRPGGLTALAVLNFVFGGWGLLNALGAAAAALSPDLRSEMPVELRALDPTFWWLVAGINLVVGSLLIASGVGYLGMKRVLGRVVGNACALLQVAAGVAVVAMTGTLDMVLVFQMIYPVLTLILVNTTFRDDLVHG
jgi:hypothetical protein